MIATRSLSMLLLLGLIVVCPSNYFSFAQDDEDAIVGLEQPRFTISEQQFDQNVFNIRGAVVIANGGQRRPVVVSQTSPIEQAKNLIEAAINAEIAFIDSRCQLTEHQKKKLRLAGRGDIADFIARAMELRRRCTSKPLTQQEYSAFHAEMQGLRMMTQSGSINDAALFRKTMRSLLTDEQAARYGALERERRVSMITESLNAQWGQNAKPVRLAKQTQDNLVNVLLEHGRLPTNQSPYRLYLVLLEINRLEDRLKPLLSDEEWDQLKFPISQAKRIEPFLRSSGQLAAEEVVDEINTDAMKD